MKILWGISANFFFFFFETVDSLCLQWNCTPWQLVDYIFFHLSNLHSTIFIFCQKMSYICLKSETLCSIWSIFVQISSHRMWKSFLGRHNTTCKAGKDDSQAYGFHYQNFQILNVDGVSFKSHQRCLPHSLAKKSDFEIVPGVSENLGGQGFWAACHLMWGVRDINDYVGSRTLLLWGLEHKLVTYHLN